MNEKTRNNEHMNADLKQVYAIPAAIVISGALIAGAVIFSNNSAVGGEDAENNNNGGELSEENFRMPDESDHTRGSEEPAVTLVEFSDFECPFCGRLHPTLSHIIEEHDDVAWVYRHFPLNSHRNARSAAVASECVAKLAGNDAFWDFTDSAFKDRSQLGDQFYKDFARSAGIEADAFTSCMNDQSVASDVQDDLDEVMAIGGRGTPHVVVVSENGELTQFSGALPYQQISSLVDRARNN